MRQRRSEAGQTIAIVALSMFLLLGFLGLGIDMGYMRFMKRRLQKAADAAALAGALELNNCNGALDCSALTTAAQNSLNENGFSGNSQTLKTQTSSCAGSTADPIGLVTITVNNGPLCLGSSNTDPNYQSSVVVEVEVSENLPMLFAKTLGFTSAEVVARAEAGIGPNPGCIEAIGTGSSAYGIYDGTTVGTYGNAGNQFVGKSGGSPAVSVNCGVVSDSANPSNGITLGGGSMTAQSIYVASGGSHSGGTFSPTVTSGPPVADPLANTPLPSCVVSHNCACDHVSDTTSATNPTNWFPLPVKADNICSGKSALPPGTSCANSSTLVLPPGVYCGGIDGDSGTIEFANSPTSSKCNNQPGCFINVGGDFSAHGGTNQIGTGVTFILTGVTQAQAEAAPYSISNPTVAYYLSYGNGGGGGEPYGISMDNAGGYSTLSAPTTGTYAGILFFQDPNAGIPTTVNGKPVTMNEITNYIQRGSNSSPASYFNGALYFPTTRLVFCAPGITCTNETGGYTVLDALDIGIEGNVTFNNNYSTLSGLSPFKVIAILGE